MVPSWRLGLLLDVFAEVVLDELDASTELSDSSPHLHHSPDEHLGVWVEVPVVSGIRKEEPIRVMGVVFGSKDVDDGGDYGVQLAGADGGGLDPVEGSGIDLGYDRSCFRDRCSKARPKPTELVKCLLNPFRECGGLEAGSC